MTFLLGRGKPLTFFTVYDLWTIAVFLVQYVRASFHFHSRLEISIGRDTLNMEPGNTLSIIGWCCVEVIGFHMIPVTGFSLSYNY